MKIKANGIMQNYEITGKSGDWLVLLHGISRNLNTWYNQVPAFSKHYKVLTYDIRGLGQTDLAGNYTYETWANDLYGLMQALGIKEAHFLGWSLGGHIAVTFILKHPEMVKSLILSNSNARSAYSKQIVQKVKFAEGGQEEKDVLEKEGMLGIFKLRDYLWTPGYADKHPEVMEKQKEIVLQNRPEGYRDIMLWGGQREGPLTESDYEKINCPTLIISGEFDARAAGPEMAKKLQQMIHGAELKIFPTAHSPAIEIPEEYNQTVLDFLAKAKKEQGN